MDHLAPWEEVFTDSSGKFRRKSKQGNNYLTEFVCAKTGDKIAIPHVKRKHFPLVYFEFTTRMGRHPKYCTVISLRKRDHCTVLWVLLKSCSNVPHSSERPKLT